MGDRMNRQERLYKLLDLARTYRGWSRKELARALGRDPAHVYPDTDNPKIDFLVALADALEWPLDAVVEYLWVGLSPEAGREVPGGMTFDELDRQVMELEQRGEHTKALEHIRAMHSLARTPLEHARACRRECSAWDGLGRYSKSLAAAQLGLRQRPLPHEFQLVLQALMANAHYALGDLTPAIGIASCVIDWFARHVPDSLQGEATHAFAHYVRGNSQREMIGSTDGQDGACEWASRAQADLATACRLYQEAGERHDREDFRAVANTCAGGLLDVEVELGKRDANETVDVLLAGVPTAQTAAPRDRSDWVESWAWWCVFAGGIALRRLDGARLQQVVAVASGMLLELADRLDNWALRQRALLMQHHANEKLARQSGLRFDATIDDEDMRIIAGTMGRFPGFRPVGWRILESAKVVRNEIV